MCAKSPEQQPLGIKSWSEDDRPREKLLSKGYLALSNAELIAILLGSGTRNESAVEVAKRLLDQADNNLNKLGKFTLKRLSEPKGIGQAKAVTVAAALELGRRRKNTEHTKPQIKESNQVHEYMAPYFADLTHEHFYVLLLDRANKVIRSENISKGGVSGTVVDPKMVFKQAIDNLASSVIVCHNHPSGNKKPSEEDKRLTKRLQEGAEYLDLRVLDHLIITDDKDNGYLSFADEGLM